MVAGAHDLVWLSGQDSSINGRSPQMALSYLKKGYKGAITLASFVYFNLHRAHEKVEISKNDQEYIDGVVKEACRLVGFKGLPPNAKPYGGMSVRTKKDRRSPAGSLVMVPAHSCPKFAASRSTVSGGLVTEGLVRDIPANDYSKIVGLSRMDRNTLLYCVVHQLIFVGLQSNYTLPLFLYILLFFAEKAVCFTTRQPARVIVYTILVATVVYNYFHKRMVLAIDQEAGKLMHDGLNVGVRFCRKQEALSVFLDKYQEKLALLDTLLQPYPSCSGRIAVMVRMMGKERLEKARKS